MWHAPVSSVMMFSFKTKSTRNLEFMIVYRLRGRKGKKDQKLYSPTDCINMSTTMLVKTHCSLLIEEYATS